MYFVNVGKTQFDKKNKYKLSHIHFYMKQMFSYQNRKKIESH